jgi:hypothetical protein
MTNSLMAWNVFSNPPWNRTWRSRLRILSIGMLLTLGIDHRIVLAQSASDEARSLLTACKLERAKLMTGRYRASGRITYSNGENPLEIDVEIHSAFDRYSGSLRFDRKGHFPKGIATVPGGIKKDRIVDDVRTILTPDQFVTTERPEIILLTARAKAEYPYGAWPLDLLNLGFNSRLWLAHRVDWTELLPNEFKWNAEKVLRQPGEPTRIVWNDPKNDIARVLWIDEQQGYSPTRCEFHTRPLDAAGAAPFPDPKQQEFAIQLQWAKKGGTWVPVTLRKQGDETAEINFTWESVNEPISRELFMPNGLGVSPDTEVQDARFGKTVILGPVGKLYRVRKK